MKTLGALTLLGLTLGAQTLPIDVTNVDTLELVDAKAAVVQHQGRKALKLTESSGQPSHLAIVRGAKLRDGTIEVDIAGQPAGGASGGARGFVGIAFRMEGAAGAQRYEHIYLRPTNGRAEDQVRRNHAVQYSAHPDFPWNRLRKEEPEKYESYADLEPGIWTKVKIVIEGAKARLYLRDAPQPTLIVNDLKLGAGSEASPVALWIGPEAEGYFSNLRITPK